MFVNEITASFGSTLQIQQYEPVKFHSSVKMTIEEGDDIGIAYSEAYRLARDSVREQVQEVKSNKQTALVKKSSLAEQIKLKKEILKKII